jgi:hypothetical protein|tara:strand:- start:558 stop:761 length:204 start_codon:yes stop_codon:yes gene_type:complete
MTRTYKKTFVRIDLDKTEFDIMCNTLGMSLFGRNNLKNPLVKIFLPKIKYTLQQEAKKGGMRKLKDV